MLALLFGKVDWINGMRLAAEGRQMQNGIHDVDCCGCGCSSALQAINVVVVLNAACAGHIILVIIVLLISLWNMYAWLLSGANDGC
jgi:hypothetical protein